LDISPDPDRQPDDLIPHSSQFYRILLYASRIGRPANVAGQSGKHHIVSASRRPL
jgi:hypothetical protein